eukprot:5775964-Prymnesium_polylepis.1
MKTCLVVCSIKHSSFHKVIERKFMWVPDFCPIFGTFFSCPPDRGMALSSGADCSAPGIYPCPLRGSRPTQGRPNVPRLVGIARHPTRAMRPG